MHIPRHQNERSLLWHRHGNCQRPVPLGPCMSRPISRDSHGDTKIGPCCAFFALLQCMSELFDLLNFGTPHVYDTPNRHRSLSPSPRGRIAWDQPSSSPREALSPLLAVPPAKPYEYVPEQLEKENSIQVPEIQRSPSVIRNIRARRRSRAQHPYTYNMCSLAPPPPPLQSKASSPKHKRRRTHIQRVQSDPVVSPIRSTHADTKQPSSDDSFSRVLDEDFPIDPNALEEVAAKQGW